MNCSAILKWLEHYPVRVQVLPAMQDLAAGRVTVNALRPVEVDILEPVKHELGAAEPLGVFLPGGRRQQRGRAGSAAQTPVSL